MTAPQLEKDWTVTPNLRNTYVSLVTMTAWWFYQAHVALLATDWTLIGTSDGTTGPTDLNDATDRLTDETKTATRATVAAGAQSYAIWENADGVQLLLAFQGATDDTFRVAYSRAGLYVLAATKTHQPTATDELIVSTGTVIGTGTSLDRVVHILASDDDRSFAIITYRSAALQSAIGLWHCTSLAAVRVSNPIFDVPYVGFRFTSNALLLLAANVGVGGVIGAATNAQSTTGGISARVYTDSARTVALGGGQLSLAALAGVNPDMYVDGTSRFIADKPAAQDSAATPLLPIYWSGVRAVNTDGLYASPIDWFAAYASVNTVPAVADPFDGYAPGDTPGVTPVRARWMMSLGSAMVIPWSGAAAMATS